MLEFNLLAGDFTCRAEEAKEPPMSPSIRQRLADLVWGSPNSQAYRPLNDSPAAGSLSMSRRCVVNAQVAEYGVQSGTCQRKWDRSENNLV
jgi:hypothetical protein